MISKVMVQETKNSLRVYKELEKELTERIAQLSEERYKQAGVSGVRMGESIPTVSVSEHVRVLDYVDKIEALEERIHDIRVKLAYVDSILQWIEAHEPDTHEAIKAVYLDGVRYEEYADKVGITSASLKRKVDDAIALALRSRFRL